MCSVSDDSSGWSDNTDWGSIYCVYDTSTLLERICMPGEEVLSQVDGLQDYMSTVSDVSKYQQWFNDVKNSWQLLLIAVGIAFFLGLVYMIFTRIFAGIIVWIFVLAYFAGIGFLGYYVYDKSVKEQECLDAAGTDPGYYSDTGN